MNTRTIVFCAAFVGIAITYSVVHAATKQSQEQYQNRPVTTKSERHHGRRGEALRHRQQSSQEIEFSRAQ